MITLVPSLKILCTKFLKFVRTVGSEHIVIIPIIRGFQTGKNLNVYAAIVLFCVLLVDASDK
jgi:hypothetical protein